MIAELRRRYRRILVLAADQKRAEETALDIGFFSGGLPIQQLIGWDSLPLENVSPQPHVSAQRIHSLFTLLEATEFVATASVDAILQRILPRQLLTRLSFELTADKEISRDDLLRALDNCGFRRVSLVEEVGEMAVRGSVVDLFCSTQLRPLRLEFRDDKIISLRDFDPDSQRTLQSLEKVRIIPVSERFPLSTDDALFSKTAHNLKARARELEIPPRIHEQLLEVLRSGADIPGIELLQTAVLPELETVFDYLPSDTLIVIDDELQVLNTADRLEEELTDRAERLRHEGYVFPRPSDFYLESGQLTEHLQRHELIVLDSLQVAESLQEGGECVSYRASSNLELATRLKTLIGTGRALKPLDEFLRHAREEGYRVVFCAGSSPRAERLHKLLLDLGWDIPIYSGGVQDWLASPHRPELVIIPGAVSSGVKLPLEKLIFLAESEIFSERSQRRSSAVKATNIKRLLSAIAQLKDGDFVVHNDFGIGVYRGLKHMQVDGAETDLLHIDYADSRLYLPVQNIGKIQKFVSADGKPPQIDKLSSQRWINTKRKVRESVAALAGELIKLYAARSVAKGWRFDVAGAEDERFADGFAFNETPDQLKAIEDTLGDMADDRPMDRLICGDVGFGKTEVAMRAAFKCIQHAKQVAVLAPTTLLAEQHRQSFSNRFLGYPVKIGAISRFYKPAQNKLTLQEIASGDLDIIIGTHRILSRDVRFADLGLVIVDEEHRFGVKQKEKLKQLKKQVDVLTLTATPIPRTLHMALLGIRDISLINTPPQDRRVIRTYIASHDDMLIRDAVLRELQRGGQCFYLHNRVESIASVCAHLQETVPEAKFEFAHGQMSEDELERIMNRFLKGSVDCLVCTSIIESGLDIPNANTILIERADALGLAQLYQLRGRVGRSSRQAYAYLLLPKSHKMSNEAQKRLKAIQALDDLSMGFNLAVRDLEIRGAGNLLGKEQSGNVLLVGYELYTRILKEAIMSLKGEDLELEEAIDPEVKIPIDAYIPQYYIPDVSERLVLYQRLASLVSSRETDELILEVEDRFGAPSREVLNLIELMRVRSLMKQFGIEKAEFSEARFTLTFSARAPIDPEKIMQLVKEKPGHYRFSRSHALAAAYESSLLQTPELIYPMLEALLDSLRS